MILSVVVRVVFMVAALFFALGGIGAKESNDADRSMLLALIFTAAVVFLMIASK